MPGSASLRAGRYYAHPRNAFWPILGGLCGFAADAPYAERVRGLSAQGIAVWDVLQRCERVGSLDSSILAATAEVNDFAAFFSAHPAIVAVCCNGGTAFRLFRTRVAARVEAASALPCRQLPSTSPAYAALSAAAKARAWRAALRPWLL